MLYLIQTSNGVIYLKRIILIIISFIFLSIDVNALDLSCTQAEQVRLRQLANATKISYEFYENETDYTYGFNIIVSGYSPDFYIYNEKNGTYIPYSNSPIAIQSGFFDGRTYELPFWAADEGPCNGYKILTKYVILPKYNPYYKSESCIGYEEFELCKKFTSISIGSDERFEQLLNNYKKDLENKNKKDDIEKEKEPENTMWENILNFIYNYYMIFLLIIIISGTAGIVVLEVKRRRSIL